MNTKTFEATVNVLNVIFIALMIAALLSPKDLEEFFLNLGGMFLVVESVVLYRQVQYLKKKRRPWCSTCGRDVKDVTCINCAEWWKKNPGT